MSLKLGIWKINVNGGESNLALTSVDQNGVVAGQLDITEIAGLWDEASRTLTFGVKPPHPPGDLPAGFNALAIMPSLYKGFLFSTPRNAGPGQDILWTLAGFVEVAEFSAATQNGGNARRTTFGWFAQTTEVS
jgi:hypothetical protein